MGKTFLIILWFIFVRHLSFLCFFVYCIAYTVLLRPWKRNYMELPEITRNYQFCLLFFSSLFSPLTKFDFQVLLFLKFCFYVLLFGSEHIRM